MLSNLQKMDKTTVQKRILTGMQPSGRPHIGNYLGMIKPALAYQDKTDYEVFFAVVDLHSLTSSKEPAVLRENITNTVLDWLSLGLDPEKVNLFKQSDVPAHTKSTWLMLCQTPMGLLQRSHSYKDKIAKGLPASAGLFTYPVLMTMDILLYQATKVPVGKDQKQHLEIARDLAQKWNERYGKTFIVPEAEIQEDVAVIPGIDGQKMSKSYGNTIPLFASAKDLKKKVMRIQTQNVALGDKIDPKTCNVFRLHEVLDSPHVLEVQDGYKNGTMGFGESKKRLLSHLTAYLAPFHEKRRELEQRPDFVADILAMGAKKANILAEQTYQTMVERIGLR